MSFDPAHLWESMGIVSKVIFFVMIIMGIASLSGASRSLSPSTS